MIECPICCEENVDQLSCGHFIHNACIISSGKAECPLCRQYLVDFEDLVTPIPIDQPDMGLFDKLIAMQIIDNHDVPIIDSLNLENDHLKTTAAWVIHTIKSVRANKNIDN